MTPRYRCAFCGSFSSKTAKEVRDHMSKAHRRAMEWLIRPLKAFHEVLDPEEI